MKDLAVLIPVYNDSAALIRTLDSIEEVDTSFTVVVVDDGSEKPVHVPVERYPFSIRVLRMEKNGGIVAALNHGLGHICEEGFRLVARLDAADLNHPNRFHTQYRHLEENPSLALLGSNVVFRDETNGEPLFTTNLPLNPESARRWIEFRTAFIHPAVMMRTDVVREIGFYDGNYRHIEDYVLFYRIVKKYAAANLVDPLVDCFVRKNGISRLHHRSQLLSGIRFKLRHPRPFNPLWHAYIFKRVSFLVVPHSFRDSLKRLLGLTKQTADTLSSPSSLPEHT